MHHYHKTFVRMISAYLQIFRINGHCEFWLTKCQVLLNIHESSVNVNVLHFKLFRHFLCAGKDLQAFCAVHEMHISEEEEEGFEFLHLACGQVGSFWWVNMICSVLVSELYHKIITTQKLWHDNWIHNHFNTSKDKTFKTSHRIIPILNILTASPNVDPIANVS